MLAEFCLFRVRRKQLRTRLLALGSQLVDGRGVGVRLCILRQQLLLRLLLGSLTLSQLPLGVGLLGVLAQKLLLELVVLPRQVGNCGLLLCDGSLEV